MEVSVFCKNEQMRRKLETRRAAFVCIETMLSTINIYIYGVHIIYICYSRKDAEGGEVVPRVVVVPNCRVKSWEILCRFAK